METSFAANGKAVYQICHKTATKGEVDKFPTPQELWDKTFSEPNEWLEKFSAVPFEDINGMKQARYYQELAVNHAIEAIAKDESRILLTLATGTGKTFIAFQIEKLFKSRWTLQRDGKQQPRILFLINRNILADGAIGDFNIFDEAALVRIETSEIAKRGKVPKNGKPYFVEYKRDFFDLIIIDECHRGSANDQSAWRDILEHFSGAVHLGLTATPKRTDNADTYHYFGEPEFPTA